MLNLAKPEAEIIELSNEDIDTPDHEAHFDAEKYQSLLLICRDHVRKYKNPAMTLANYLLCWTQDMESQIIDAGANPRQMAAHLLWNLSYSDPSLGITSDLDTTSSSSSKPTKMASPTSLF